MAAATVVQPVFVVRCPHCLQPVLIEEVRCRIFRHGQLADGRPLDPHAPEEECAKAVAGCGRPFMLHPTAQPGGWVAKKCAYI